MSGEKHFHYDEAKVIAGSAKLREARLPLLDLPGSRGSQARFNEALLPGFMLALAREANRGTAGNDIGNGVAGAIANIIMSYGECIEPPGAPPEFKLAFVNTMSMRIAACLRQALTGEAPARATFVVEPEQSGQA